MITDIANVKTASAHKEHFLPKYSYQRVIKLRVNQMAARRCAVENI